MGEILETTFVWEDPPGFFGGGAAGEFSYWGYIPEN